MEQLVVFVCATTGQGDPPDNMKVDTYCLVCVCVCVCVCGHACVCVTCVCVCVGCI